jgi:hypothetical protein
LSWCCDLSSIDVIHLLNLWHDNRHLVILSRQITIFTNPPQRFFVSPSLNLNKLWVQRPSSLTVLWLLWAVVVLSLNLFLPG